MQTKKTIVTKISSAQLLWKTHLTKPYKVVFLIAISLLLTVLLLVSYIYASSPTVVRDPKLEHYHFRMQIVVNGKAENFAEDKYQQDYAKDQCNANLPEQPIHFHDQKDQFTHIHWEGMTGGMVMKYYGWNYIGGLDGALGYKLNDLGDIQKVTTHGNYLPSVSDNTNFYVYTGDGNDYQKRSFDEWVNKDLEVFFNKTSNAPAHNINQQKTSFSEYLSPTAYAHGTEDHTTSTDSDETEKERLTRINNLLGNVVIFAQNNEPTEQQIQARFNDLEPLTDSTCGG